MRILLISGSLRSGSTNAAALRTAVAVAPSDVDMHLYEGMEALPHFNPDDDLEGSPPAPVAGLRADLAAADAVLVSTPEYAGALPGVFKELLEWTVGGGELYRKPVAWLNVAGVAAPSGGADAHESLRKVLVYVGAEIVEAACARLPVSREAIGEGGEIEDAASQRAIRASLDVLIAHAAEARGARRR